MPRRPRFVVEDYPYHVVQRGNNRAVAFFDTGDYGKYLNLLEESAEVSGCQIHAYVLMTNHVHLLMTPRVRDSVSRTMQLLGSRYVQYINKKHDRTGSLWEGRFRSCLVDSDRYVLACYRYIELNPVRAELAKSAADYRFSSYRHNGLGYCQSLITEHPTYLDLGSQLDERLAGYRQLFQVEHDKEELDRIRESLNSGLPYGSDAFKSFVRRAYGYPIENKRPGRPGREQGT